MRIVETKFALGKYWKPVKMFYDLGRIFFPYIGFSRIFNAEVKMMEGHKYHGYEGAPYRDYCIKTFGRDKLWSCKDSQHNAFHIAFLEGKNPYERYQRKIEMMLTSARPLYNHQFDMTAFILARRQCIIAGEMGVGKTLSEIEAREAINPIDPWYVAPRSALKAVERELRKWNCKSYPELMTYRGLVRRMKELEGVDFVPPQWVTFDESSCIKTYNAQRTQAARMIADAIREHWKDDAYIVLMTGTPSPKSPLDWWSQCEIACPGFLIEGDENKFKNRLAVLVDRDFGGGVHKHIAGWKDRDDICDKCGLIENDPIHQYNSEIAEAGIEEDCHEFKLAINEVKLLHKRIVEGGLVIVKKKKDCIDLPEKRFEKIELEPTKKILQIARTMCRTAPSVAEALTRCRTLSDGFMYEMEKVGIEQCSICEGKKEVFDWVLKTEFEGEPISDYRDDGSIMSDEEFRERFFNYVLIECVRCGGAGEIDSMARHMREVSTPKEDAIRELIGEHEQIGRLVVYGAFQGSVDKITRIFDDMGWNTIRWDGRGVHCSVPDIDPLDLFQDKLGDFPSVGFIGQPGAAGMGLTLTASPSCIFYSNTYNAMDRLQARERVHRIGMDVIRGATIYDLLHLPTDYLVSRNIEEKIARQDLTLGLDISMADVLESLNG
jgi:SNF2 family DNA or RNA helicase